MRPYLLFVLSWLIPGAGHFVQKKYLKGSIFLLGIVLLIILGLIMQGKFYKPYTETTLPNGKVEKNFQPLLLLGFLGDLGNGIFFFLIHIFGLNKGNIEAVSFNYGTCYLVSAGLINYLIALNSFDIAKGKRK